MSFPNPDNYARDCDCGTSGVNTTPPPASLITEAADAVKVSPFVFSNGGTITMTNSVDGVAGNINTSGGENGVGGSIDTSNGGGSINISGGGGGGAGGSIYTYGYSDNNGGSLNLNADVNYNGGNIDLSGATAGADAPSITCGTNAPTASLPNGSIYLRVDGGYSTTLYVRAAGVWIAK
jgi:hypothetical protein